MGLLEEELDLLAAGTARREELPELVDRLYKRLGEGGPAAS